MVRTHFNKIDCDWVNVKNKCRTTVNKTHTETYPTTKFKKQILISEHSPIRLLQFDWMWANIKSWCAGHWVRHRWESFVSTQREDRTGVPRSELSQDELVTFEGQANCQHLIDTWRKRLCCCASPETRQLAEDFKAELLCNEEPEIGAVLVPNCVYRNGCPEFEPCGVWEAFKKAKNITGNETIQERYDKYNEWFMERR